MLASLEKCMCGVGWWCKKDGGKIFRIFFCRKQKIISLTLGIDMNLLIRNAKESLQLLCESFLMRDVVEVLFVMSDQLPNNCVNFFKFFNFFDQK